MVVRNARGTRLHAAASRACPQRDPAVRGANGFKNAVTPFRGGRPCVRPTVERMRTRRRLSRRFPADPRGLEEHFGAVGERAGTCGVFSAEDPRTYYTRNKA